MVMARSPSREIEKAALELTPLQEAFLNALADGRSPYALAKELAHGDKKKRKRLRAKFREMAHQPHIQEAAGLMAKGEAILGVLPATNALVRKASTGRVDAIKLLYESSGYHNTRTDVNHSGDIQITLKGLPRPEPVVDVDSVEDAQVID